MTQEMWDIQNQFTNKVLSRIDKPLSEFDNDDKIRWTKEYLLCIIKECTEVLDKLNWKKHRVETITSVNIEEVSLECIDIQKFLWGLMQIWNITYNDFVKTFYDKTQAVENRWHQEFENESR